MASSLLAFRCVEGQRSTTKHDDNITTARDTSDVANRWANVISVGRVLSTVIGYNDNWTVTRLVTFLIRVCIRSAGRQSTLS